MSKVKVGNKAPDFTLLDDSGEKVKLSSLRGKKVVLYFYPRDNTPGCTQQACDFRDAKRKFDRQEAVILGVSPDKETTHEKFKSKFKLPFRLLADPEKKVSKLYDVLKEKNMYGKKVMGIERSTFLIDEDGTLVEEMRKVKVQGHIENVLAQVKRL